MADGYFKEYGRKIRYVLNSEVENGYGLRPAQLGALQSIGAHFAHAKTGKGKEPALVVMPTGSGKTAVLMLAAFQERAERVLVITPSRIVRDQIATDFGELRTLHKLNVLPERDEIPAPKVKEQTGKIGSDEGWDGLREFDVVVSTPRSASPAMKDVAEPPHDLFDLILVDEAHHQPAKTWTELLRSFPEAKQASFTATPFRRDEEKVEGELVFHYTIQQALEDGIFSDIQFEEAEVGEEESDIAIARRAEEVFRRDRDAGLKHYLMARAKSKKDANRLAEVYKEHTNLDLRVIHSGHAYSRVERSINDLREEEIDGVICVDMLGEGFDFPRLKIAALHAPHKSLPVTLQFIGRFARETDDETGDATFIAVHSDIEIESTRLFSDSVAWGKIIPELSRGKIEEENRIRETLDRFEVVKSRFEGVEELPLYDLTPYKHVKVYRTSEDVDLSNRLNLPSRLKLVQRHSRDDGAAVVFVTRSEERPDWSNLEEFRSIEHDLFVIYYDSNTNLLFINASLKSIGLYESIASSFTSGEHRILPLYELNRVLSSLRNPAFYNIGMRSRVHHSGNESYRITAGPRPDNEVTKTDGQLYHRGHVFGGGESGNEQVNIGFSSGAKIWSTTNVSIPNLLEWCENLTTLLESDRTISTGTGLDNLPVSEEVTEVPDNIIGVEWPADTYERPPQVEYNGTNGASECLILDLELDAESVGQHIQVHITALDLEYQLRYSPTSFPFYERDSTQPEIVLTRGVGRDSVRLVDYLNNHPLSLFLPDFSRIEGEEKFSGPSFDDVLSENRYRCIDWEEEGVDVQREFTDEDKDLTPQEGYVSIHDYLKERLRDSNDLVFYDHTKGEAADFVTLSEENEQVICKLHHCKSSGGENPGARPGDIYEICGQAIRCLRYLNDMDEIVSHVKRREREVELPHYVKGDSAALDDLKEVSEEQGFRFEVVLVQPGISRTAVTNNPEKGRLLTSCDRYLVDSGAEEVRIVASE